MTDVSNNQKIVLARDRFLEACPIRYDCRNLFIYLIEMEYCPDTDSIEVLLKYPEKRDNKYFKDEKLLNDFENNVKKFAYPYIKTLNKNKIESSKLNKNSSSLVQFYTFVFTDINRTRQYGFCRSAQSGNHILCMISYLPWYNLYMNILNKISHTINEKETHSVYNLLEALYEYQLPEPGNIAEILSHDGQEEIKFICPDRRILPTIHENRNLLKFFAFFDLETIKKIFTSLLLERSILVVSKDLENLTSCGLSFEYLIYPLEWLHTFVPIVPEHIEHDVFTQPFPFIYGVHTCIFEKINKSHLNHCVILLVDEKKILNADKDQLPARIAEYLTKKLINFDQIDPNDQGTSGSLGSSRKVSDFLRTGPIKAFLECVLMIIDDYRKYILYDQPSDDFKFDEKAFFKTKNVYHDSSGNKYQNNQNEFYHEFRITQAFEEFCRDRADYLRAERIFLTKYNKSEFPKDFIQVLFDQLIEEKSKFTNKIDKTLRDLKIKTNLLVNNAKEKSSNLIKARKQTIKKNFETKYESDRNQEINSFSSYSADSNDIYVKNNPNLNIDENNSNYDENLTLTESDDASESSSSSSTHDDQIKKSIETFARATKNYESENSNYKNRFTIDLSNDPDIRKYFENNFNENSFDNSSMQKENLIDLSDEKINVSSDLSNSIFISEMSTQNQIESIFDTKNESSSSSNTVFNKKITSRIDELKSIFENPNQIQHSSKNNFNSEITSTNKIDLFDNIFNDADLFTNTNNNPKQKFKMDSESSKNVSNSNISDVISKPFQPNYNINLNATVNSPNNTYYYGIEQGASQSLSSMRPINPVLPKPFLHNYGYQPIQYKYPIKDVNPPISSLNSQFVKNADNQSQKQQEKKNNYQMFMSSIHKEDK